MKKWFLSLVVLGIFFLSFFGATPIFADPSCNTQSDCPDYGWCVGDISWNAEWRMCSATDPSPGVPANTCYDYYEWPNQCTGGTVCVDHGSYSSCDTPLTPTATPTPAPYCRSDSLCDSTVSDYTCGPIGTCTASQRRTGIVKRYKYNPATSSCTTDFCYNVSDICVSDCTCNSSCPTLTPTPTPTPACPGAPGAPWATAVLEKSIQIGWE
jgi:hypothetical protein